MLLLRCEKQNGSYTALSSGVATIEATKAAALVKNA